MEMKHTAEPWSTNSCYDICGDIDTYTYITVAVPFQEEDRNYKANADRIVACVNAMKDIKDPEKFMKDMNIIKGYLKTIKKPPPVENDIEAHYELDRQMAQTAYNLLTPNDERS